MLEPHPLADIFPMMHEKEFDELAEDIKVNGLREEIAVYEGKILDGRNRYKACLAVGVEPRTRKFLGDDPATTVMSLNVHRRHLSKSQLAVVALDLIPACEKEAKMRMSKGGRKTPKQGVEKIPHLPRPPRTREIVGEKLGVNDRYIQDAKKLTPETKKLVKDGAVSLPQGMRMDGVKAPRKPGPDKKKRAASNTKVADAVQTLAQCITSGEDVYKTATAKQRAQIDDNIRHAYNLVAQLKEQVKL